MKLPKLKKSCPFCNSKVRWCGFNQEDPEDDHDCDQIHCDNCGIQFVDETSNKSTLNTARKAIAKKWERRE